MSPFFPLNTSDFFRDRCRICITPTILVANECGSAHRFSTMVVTSSGGTSSMKISANRFRRARESVFRPPYVPGFCVAKSMNRGCGRTTSFSSGTYSSWLSSKSRFSASSTSVGARLSSSRMTQWPARRACTRAPSWNRSLPSSLAT